MTDPDREADMVVADDAELEGRLDVARELRARHLSPIELRADEYRMQLGLLPWRVHAEQTQARIAKQESRIGVKGDSGRRSGRTTSALLLSLARCEVEGWPCLTVLGRHGWDRAGELCEALGCKRVVLRKVTFEEQLNGRRPVVYVDHFELESHRYLGRLFNMLDVIEIHAARLNADDGRASAPPG